jgi:hypothetical protein
MMATKKQIAGWVKQIEKRMAGVAAERDKLDETISSLQDLEESCTRAYDALQEARDALSELV